MTSMMFQKSAPGIAVRYAPLSLSAQLLPRCKRLRLRRKIPSWTGRLLLALVANGAMAALAWGAVYLVLN